MKVLTYTSYKKHCDLYTEIHGSIAVDSCQIEPPQKDVILLSEVSIVVYKTGKRTGVENTKFISFNFSAGTYSIDDFNAKIKLAILGQYWEPPKTKDLSYTFMASNTIFIALGIQDNYLEKTTRIRSTLALAHTKHLLIRHLLQYDCYCTTNKSTKSKTSWMDTMKLVGPHACF